MKKLLITTLAAVSVGLCAKAEDTGFISGTSFDEEELTVGEAFNPTDTYWTLPTDTDDVFKITNVTYSADATKQHWDWTDGEKALSIDTANPILRNVNPVPQDDTTIINPPQDVTTPVFFDSVVQFTATDVAPSMENNTTDKLAVWLYTSPDDVATTPGLFGETSPITKVAVTAGYSSDGVNLITKNYLTDIAVEPDTWHRLTIKSFKVSADGDLLFNIWVDKTQVSGKETIEAQETTTDFLSRIPDSVNGETFNTLQGVAFDGKGAVDDIVFTTTDPFAVPSYEITVKLSDDEGVSGGYYKAYSINGGNDFITLDDTIVGEGVKLTLPTTVETILFKMAVADGYKIDGETASRGEAVGDGYYWTIPVALADIVENGEGEISLAIVEDNGTEDPVTTYAVSVVANAVEATVGGLSAEYAEGNVVTFTVVAATGYTIEGVAVASATTAPVLTVNGDVYSFTMPAEAVTITVTTKAIEEEVTYPSVGGVETPEYSDKAKAAIDAAFPENSYPTGGLTVKVNGETLTGDPAVAMLNDAVEMFTLAGDAKFFDEDGVMDISFKATNPLMETETAEATDYEAKVGEATATVTSNYTVNKETVDLTPGVAGENEAVTFKLVIKPAGSTGSDAGSAVQE